MYCKNCGAEIDDKAVVCPRCGVQVQQMSGGGVLADVKDDGNFGWGILGCCVPIVGLILYLVWKDTKPKTAKMAGKGALVCVGVLAVYYLFVIIFAIVAGSSAMY